MRVLVTGGTGLVGKAVQAEVSRSKRDDGVEWTFLSSNAADLRCFRSTKRVFREHSPTHVLHLAARVGGLNANIDRNFDFFSDNMQINENVLRCCREMGVSKVVSCLSTCIFPDGKGLIDESMLHDGAPHPSNMGYSYAKRMIDVHNRAWANQYRAGQFTSVVPTNVFGPHDNFDLHSGHVLPCLVHKCLLAKRNGTPFVVQGSGAPLRQFLYSPDMAKILIRVLHEYNDPEPLILAPGTDAEITIADAAETIARAIGFKGNILFDESKPDGQHRKTASNAKLCKLFPDVAFTPFEDAIRCTCEWLRDNFERARGTVPIALCAASSPPKVALITGITGQDGSYLAELLLSKGYEVHGIIRRCSLFNTSRIDHISDKLCLHYGDLTDSSVCCNIVAKVRPDEIYNLGAQSHVKVSYEMPEYTADTDALGVVRLLDAIRAAGLANHARVYQASTSELFGKVQEVPQRETTPFYPRSPYAVAKQYAYWSMINYREAYGMHLSNGILFNHESPRRGETFVTRKVTIGVAKIHLGLEDCIVLGNLDAQRDWGHAKDYVEMMWRMLQQDEPDDYVAATGQTHTIRSFVEMAFAVVGMKIAWRGKGVEEQGYDADGLVRVKVDPRYFRPAEVDLLIGDPSKAEKVLGWKAKTCIRELCEEMVQSDVARLKKI